MVKVSMFYVYVKSSQKERQVCVCVCVLSGVAILVECSDMAKVCPCQDPHWVFLDVLI